MTRPLLHPLKEGGNLTRTQPGRWDEVQRRDQVTEIALTQDRDRNKRPSISSIPTPWARLQVFRDAILDDEHPSHEDVVNDVLDALEIVLLQDSIYGVELTSRVVSLAALERAAGGEHKQRVQRFVETLRELAPEVGGQGALGELTLVFGNGHLLFATSPFTLVFTPEVLREPIPGYFLRNRPIRPLSERPPLLAQYVEQSLMKSLSNSRSGDLEEIQKLRRVLEQQLHNTKRGTGELVTVGSGIHPLPDIELPRGRPSEFSSKLSIRPTRDVQGARPLVLDSSGSPAQRMYFDWLARPADAKVTRESNRSVLPGTVLRQAWVAPEFDFLADRLVILDAPLHTERTIGAASSKGELTDRVLLPLKSEFFRFFTAADVSRLVMLEARSGADGPVKVRLEVPTEDGKVVIEREYSKHARVGASLSLWPGFVSDDPQNPWHDYYVACFTEGEDVGQSVVLATGAHGQALAATEYQRDVSTLVHHIESAPEVVFLRQRTAQIGDDGVAEGVILPKLRQAPPPTNPPWTVAIDFGTSNTVVAYHDGSRSQPLGVTHATRFDLTRARDDAGHAAGAVFDTFFFPSVLDGTPFGTVVFKSQSADPKQALAQVPALTANVPFSGNVSSAGPLAGSRQSNEVVGDLKWGGGGHDSDRLTKLFLHQVLQLVHGEARARGVNMNGMRLRWSYPGAFSPKKRDATTTRWDNLVSEFHRTRLRSSGGGGVSIPIDKRDESTAAMLYFQTDPVAQGNFTQNAEHLKLTADVGGGTTDIAGFAVGGMVFRSSILYGGRNLISESPPGTDRGIFNKVYAWAQRNHLPNSMRRVIDAYPSNHTKFTYLVRHPWFEERRGQLADEPWFTALQGCVLYFYGALHYNIGLTLRGLPPGDWRSPDMLFFGGNGSSYLSWLTGFRSWNAADSKVGFATLFKQMLEAGYGKALGGGFAALTSTRPKQEVALGLLERPLNDVAATSSDAPPVGEAITLLDQKRGDNRRFGATETVSSSLLSIHGPAALKYDLSFPEWEIAKYNTAFSDSAMALAESVDGRWREVSLKMRAAMDELGQSTYDNQVKGALDAHLKAEDVGAVTLFIIEATLTLRHLEQRLLPSGANG